MRTLTPALEAILKSKFQAGADGFRGRIEVEHPDPSDANRRPMHWRRLHPNKLAVLPAPFGSGFHRRLRGVLLHAVRNGAARRADARLAWLVALCLISRLRIDIQPCGLVRQVIRDTKQHGECNPGRVWNAAPSTRRTLLLTAHPLGSPTSATTPHWRLARPAPRCPVTFLLESTASLASASTLLPQPASRVGRGCLITTSKDLHRSTKRAQCDIRQSGSPSTSRCV